MVEPHRNFFSLKFIEQARVLDETSEQCNKESKDSETEMACTGDVEQLLCFCISAYQFSRR